MKPAVAIDIDGVLIRGRHLLPHANEALKTLRHHSIPFVLLTNGGGRTEQRAADHLSSLGLTHLNARDIILSHTPFKSIAGVHANDNILLLGNREASLKEAAQSYGYRRVFSSEDLCSTDKSLYAFREFEATFTEQIPVIEEIQHVWVWSDPVWWGRDIQLICDVVCRSRGHVSVAFSNSDVFWSSDHPIARFGQGAFQVAAKELFRQYTEHNQGERRELTCTHYGKPHAATYAYAEQVLRDRAQGPVSRFWGIGDNPASDIRGAQQAAWGSVLVRTGVASSNEVGADHFVEHIGNAVDIIVAQKQ